MISALFLDTFRGLSTGAQWLLMFGAGWLFGFMVGRLFKRRV